MQGSTVNVCAVMDLAIGLSHDIMSSSFEDMVRRKSEWVWECVVKPQWNGGIDTSIIFRVSSLLYCVVLS